MNQANKIVTKIRIIKGLLPRFQLLEHATIIVVIAILTDIDRYAFI